MKKANETMQHMNDVANKSVDEYIQLGVKVQDELFKMAEQQMNSFREYSEFILKNQTEFFSQFEKNAKNTRELWLEGLKKWRSSVEDMTPRQ